MARVQYINGFSRQRVNGFSRRSVNATYMGQRVNGRMNGANDLTTDELANLLVDLEDGDMTAIQGCQTINGLKDWRAKHKAKKEARKAKRTERRTSRQARRTERRDQKESMRQARVDKKKARIEKIKAKAQQIGSGEGIGGKLFDLAQSYLGGDTGAMEAGMEDFGMDYTDMSDLLPVDTSGTEDTQKSKTSRWFKKNAPWSYIGVYGGGAVVILGGGYLIYRSMNKSKKRR